MALLDPRHEGQPVAMTRTSEDPGGAVGTVHLAVSHEGRFQVANGLAAFADLEWLGEPVAAASTEAGWRRIRSVLALPITDGSSPSPLRKGALLDIGPVERSDDSIRLDLAWQSDSIAPLFPIFAGHLTVSSSGLLLDGEYDPPFGRLGLLIDARLLHFVAHRTAQALLARIAGRVEAGPPSGGAERPPQLGRDGT
jgi:hypothetical protein